VGDRRPVPPILAQGARPGRRVCGSTGCPRASSHHSWDGPGTDMRGPNRVVHRLSSDPAPQAVRLSGRRWTLESWASTHAARRRPPATAPPAPSSGPCHGVPARPAAQRAERSLGLAGRAAGGRCRPPASCTGRSVAAALARPAAPASPAGTAGRTGSAVCSALRAQTRAASCLTRLGVLRCPRSRALAPFFADERAPSGSMQLLGQSVTCTVKVTLPFGLRGWTSRSSGRRSRRTSGRRSRGRACSPYVCSSPAFLPSSARPGIKPPPSLFAGVYLDAREPPQPPPRTVHHSVCAAHRSPFCHRW